MRHGPPRARPSGWARIETTSRRPPRTGPPALAPGLRAGRGLKPLAGRGGTRAPERLAPGLRAGRGLKLVRPRDHEHGGRLAPGLRAGRGLKPVRARGRARRRRAARARPSGWARIETCAMIARTQGRAGLAPGLRAGRGLKPDRRRQPLGDRLLAPGLRAGRGLKRLLHADRPGADAALAPGLRAGRGLKRVLRVVKLVVVRYSRPAFGLGED